MSQSPQIGSMFLTYLETPWYCNGFRGFCRNPLKSGQCFLLWDLKWGVKKVWWSRNPLKSGQCFLQKYIAALKALELSLSRNPLKSGQCFLLKWALKIKNSYFRYLSQSPQIGSMFLTWKGQGFIKVNFPPCRNPLKSGQCFLHGWSWISHRWNNGKDSRNPLKSGQCFLHERGKIYTLDVPNPHWSQSPQIGSMFLTHGSVKQHLSLQNCRKSQSPQIGSMFLTNVTKVLEDSTSQLNSSRNPLKSGQCFLL